MNNRRPQRKKILTRLNITSVLVWHNACSGRKPVALLLHLLRLFFPCACAVQSLPVPHQTLLFSATMPKEIEQLAAQYLNKPVKVKIGRVSVPTANVAQTLQRCGETEKVELLVALLQVSDAACCAGCVCAVGRRVGRHCALATMSDQDGDIAGGGIAGVARPSGRQQLGLKRVSAVLCVFVACRTKWSCRRQVVPPCR